MNYKASVTLKKSDTEGRVPTHTLTDFVRSELLVQLSKALRPRLVVTRHEASNSMDQVNFSTELIILQSDQWQELKDSLKMMLDALPIDQQQSAQQLVERLDNH